jgi:hypothetical protein
MELSPQDFAGYAQATGAPYPRSAAERAAMAPAVIEWKRGGQERQEQPEGRNALATAGLAGLLGLGLVGGAYGINRALQGKKEPPAAAQGQTEAPTAPDPRGSSGQEPEAQGPPPGGPPQDGGGPGGGTTASAAPAAPGAPASSPVRSDPMWPETAYRTPSSARVPSRRGLLPPTGRPSTRVAMQFGHGAEGAMAAAEERGSYAVLGNPLADNPLAPQVQEILMEKDPAKQAAMARRLDQKVRASGSPKMQGFWKQLVQQLLRGAKGNRTESYQATSGAEYKNLKAERWISDRTPSARQLYQEMRGELEGELDRIQAAWIQQEQANWDDAVYLGNRSFGDSEFNESTEPGQEQGGPSFTIDKEGAYRLNQFNIGEKEIGVSPILGKNRNQAGDRIRERPPLDSSAAARDWEHGRRVNAIEGDELGEMLGLPVPFEKSRDKAAYAPVFLNEGADYAPAMDAGELNRTLYGDKGAGVQPWSNTKVPVPNVFKQGYGGAAPGQPAPGRERIKRAEVTTVGSFLENFKQGPTKKNELPMQPGELLVHSSDLMSLGPGAKGPLEFTQTLGEHKANVNGPGQEGYIKVGSLPLDVVLKPSTRFHARVPVQRGQFRAGSISERQRAVIDDNLAWESKQPLFKLTGASGRELHRLVRPEPGYKGITQSELEKQAPAGENDYNYKSTVGYSLHEQDLRNVIKSERLRGPEHHRDQMSAMAARVASATSKYELKKARRALNKVTDMATREAGGLLGRIGATLPEYAETDGATANRFALASHLSEMYFGSKDRAIMVSNASVHDPESKQVYNPPIPLDPGLLSSGRTGMRVEVPNNTTDILPGQQREMRQNMALGAARQVRKVLKARPEVKHNRQQFRNHVLAQAAAYGVEEVDVLEALSSVNRLKEESKPAVGTPERRAELLARGPNPESTGITTALDDPDAPFLPQWGRQVMEGAMRSEIPSLDEVYGDALSRDSKVIRRRSQAYLGQVPQYLGIEPKKGGGYTTSTKVRSAKGLAPLSSLAINDLIGHTGEGIAAASHDYAEAVELARTSPDPLVREAGERAYEAGKKGSHEFDQYVSAYGKEIWQLQGLLEAKNDPDRPARLRIPAKSSVKLAAEAALRGVPLETVLQERIRESGSLADAALDLLGETMHVNYGMGIREGGEIGQEARTLAGLVQLNHRKYGSPDSYIGKLKSELSRTLQYAGDSTAGVPSRAIEITLSPAFDEISQISGFTGGEGQMMAENLRQPVSITRKAEDGSIINETEVGKVRTEEMIDTIDGIIAELTHRAGRIAKIPEGREAPADLAAAKAENARALAHANAVKDQILQNPIELNKIIADFNTRATEQVSLGVDPRSGTPIIEKLDRRGGMANLERTSGGYDTSMGNQADFVESERASGETRGIESFDEIAASQEAESALPGLDPLNDEHMRLLDVAIERHRAGEGDPALLPELEKRREQALKDRANPNYQPPSQAPPEAPPEAAALPSRVHYGGRRENRARRERNALRIINKLGGTRDRPPQSAKEIAWPQDRDSQPHRHPGEYAQYMHPERYNLPSVAQQEEYNQALKDRITGRDWQLDEEELAGKDKPGDGRATTTLQRTEPRTDLPEAPSAELPEVRGFWEPGKRSAPAGPKPPSLSVAYSPAPGPGRSIPSTPQGPASYDVPPASSYRSGAATAVRQQINARAQGQQMPAGQPVATTPRSVPLRQSGGDP